MDWSVFLSTFSLIFVAEIGDKTQFAAMAASANNKSTLSVMLAVVLALSLAGVLGVFAGKFLSSALDPRFMKWISGTLFIGIGIWTLVSK